MTCSGYAAPGAVNGVTIAFAAVAAVAVLLRLFTRVRLARNAGLDDAFITAALVCTLGLVVCTWFEVKYGMGRHASTLSSHETMMMLKSNYAAIAVYTVGLLCVKLAILLQYLRIFPSRNFRIVCYTLLCVVVAASTSFFWLNIFLCTPVEAYWNLDLPGAHCIPEIIIWFIHAGSNIVTDMAIAILPLPMLKQLQIPRGQKTVLMAVFALGGVTCIISILRLQSIYSLVTTTDQSYNGGTAALFSALELNVGIICSCIPTLKGLAAKAIPKLFSTQSNTTDSSILELGSRKRRANHNDVMLSRGHNARNAQAFASRGSIRSMELDGTGLDAKEIHVFTVVGVETEERETSRSEHGSDSQLVYEGPFHTANGSDV